jgi:hypothetical protein
MRVFGSHATRIYLEIFLVESGSVNMIGLAKLPALRQPVTTILSPSGIRAARTDPMRPAPAARPRRIDRWTGENPDRRRIKGSCQVEAEEISARYPDATKSP